MRRVLLLVVTLCAGLLLAGCGGSKGSSADMPANVVATAGDGRIVVTWTMQPNVNYWVFYAPAASISVDNWSSTPGSHVVTNAVSPFVLPGLANGVTYAFTINGRIDGGPGGSASPSVSATTRLAGSTWNTVAAMGTNDMRGVAFGSVYVAVGAGGVMYSSVDGFTWTPINFVVSTDLNAAYYFGGIYLAAGAGGIILYSTDAATWTTTTTGTTNTLYALATNAVNLSAAVGANGTILTTPNGTTWTPVSSGTTNTLYGVTYGGGKWVAVGAGGTLLTSTDGATWQAVASNTSADLKAVAYGSSTAATGAVIYVAVGANGTLVTSPDGVTWTAQPALGTNTLNAVVFASQFVAVGNGGAIFTSTDGVNWTARTSGTSNNLNAITHPPYTYSVVGSGGLFLYSN